jgi:hypothetical protein
VTAVRIAGRVLDVVPFPTGSCPDKASKWLAVSVSGVPPHETRRLSLFPCAPGDPPARPALVLEMPDDVVGFDLAEVDPAPGPELVLLSPTALELRGTTDGARLRRLPLPESVPLAPRTRELSRIPLVADWHGSGAPAALVPDRGGAAVVDLASGAVRRIALPRVTDYWTPREGPPARDELLAQEIEWPVVRAADDDGDGRADLLALSRYEVWIYHNTPEGLPAAPTRRFRLQPFSAQEELRPEATSFRPLLGDVDGDGHPDLVLDFGAGTLLESRHTTRVYRNPGSGLDLDRAPQVELVQEGGLASVRLRDLDGDGREELLRSSFRFGVLQAVRALVTRRAQVEFEVLAFRDGQLVSTWSSEIGLGLDFARGRIEDVTPSSEGDWNGDGLRDLMAPAGQGRFGIRPGRRGEAGPGFDGEARAQDLPSGPLRTVFDVDGDGLADLAVWDPFDESGALYVLRNRARLPGTPPRLTPGDVP